MSTADSIIVTFQLAVVALLAIVILGAIPLPEKGRPLRQTAVEFRGDMAAVLVLAFSLLGGFGFTILAMVSGGFR
jgi:hypothetical protein